MKQLDQFSRQKIEIEETVELQSIETFQQLHLKPDLLRGIFAFGYEKPSITQQKGLLPLISKKDSVIYAPSGTGKTSAYSIGLIQLIDYKTPNCQALILVPTRELAYGITNLIRGLGKFLKISVHCCIGGLDIKENIRILREGGIQVVVGTPGRVNDLIEKKVLKIEFLKIIIIDDIDEVLSRGFMDIIKNIIGNIDPKIQLSLFSTIKSKEIVEITDKIMQNPIKIQVKRENHQ